MPQRNYVISTTVIPEKLAALVQQLGAAGFTVTHQFERTGVILGCADESTVEAIRALPGIAAIEESRKW